VDVTPNLVSFTSVVPSPADFATGNDTMARAMSLTQLLFPGPVRVEFEDDPEIPDVSYVVFHVEAHGTSGDIIRRRLQWHDQVRELIPDSAQHLRLSVDAKP
jgi:hypothetical protein